MLTWWRKGDNSLICVSGVNSAGDPDPNWDFGHNVLPNSGGTLADYHMLQVSDAKAHEMFGAGSSELVLDGQGNPTDILTHPRLAVVASPSPAGVNATVIVAATLPKGSPDVEVTFTVDGGAPITEPVEAGGASHAYAFKAPGTYRVLVFSAHHGSTMAEVLVQ